MFQIFGFPPFFSQFSSPILASHSHSHFRAVSLFPPGGVLALGRFDVFHSLSHSQGRCRRGNGDNGEQPLSVGCWGGWISGVSMVRDREESVVMDGSWKRGIVGLRATEPRIGRERGASATEQIQRPACAVLWCYFGLAGGEWWWKCWKLAVSGVVPGVWGLELDKRDRDLPGVVR